MWGWVKVCEPSQGERVCELFEAVRPSWLVIGQAQMIPLALVPRCRFPDAQRWTRHQRYAEMGSSYANGLTGGFRQMRHYEVRQPNVANRSMTRGFISVPSAGQETPGNAANQKLNPFC